MKNWINKSNRLWKKDQIEKPCKILNHCPYGELVENYPVKKRMNDYSCKVFGHDCPIFYLAEKVTEEKISGWDELIYHHQKKRKSKDEDNLQLTRIKASLRTQAQEHHIKKEYKKALKCLYNALSKGEGVDQLFFYEIVKNYDKLLKKEPENIEYLIKKAEALIDGGDSNKAIDCYKKILKIDKNNLKKFEEIINRIDNDTILGEVCYDVKAFLLIKLGQYEEAIKVYDEAQEADDFNYGLWIEKAELYKKLKNYQKAQDCYNIIIEETEDNDELIKKITKLKEQLRNKMIAKT